MKIQQKRVETGDLPAFKRPAFADSLRFPVDVTQLSAQNLGELMGKYGALLAFVEQEATTWVIQEIRTEQALEKRTADYLRNHTKLMFLDRWRLDVRLKQDIQIQSLHRQLSIIRSLKERAQSMVRIYDRLINVLSRELSRRLSQEGPKFNAFR